MTSMCTRIRYGIRYGTDSKYILTNRKTSNIYLICYDYISEILQFYIH